MRSYYLYLFAIVSLLGFSSCSKDDASEKDVRKEVKVTATFNGLSVSSGVTTRAVDNSWEAGDAIGLFMKEAGATLTQDALANNVKYTTDGGVDFTNRSASKVYFPFNKEKVDFISYYPYRSQLNGLIYNVDVSDQKDLTAIDLMYTDSVKAVNSSAESINLDFKHQMTKVVLIINAGDTRNDLVPFTAKITNVYRKASFILSNGLITDETDAGDVVFNSDVNARAEAVILPDDDLTNSELIVTIGDVSYSYNLDKTTPGRTFDKSKKYEYSLSLRAGQGSDLGGLTATITDWETVKEDIIVDEIPKADADGGNTDAGGGVTPPVPGDGDNPTGPGEDDTPVLPDEGDGTKENPYSIAQAKGLKEFEKVWIKGYIVGSYNYSFDVINVETGTANPFNLALADLLTEESTEKFLPVNLEEYPHWQRNEVKKLNLKENPDNLGREISICCDIGLMEKFGGEKRIAAIKIYEYFFINEISGN